MREYDHIKIEKKWQSTWNRKKVYKAVNNSKKKKHYVLDMFPYPSGTGLHVGHPKGYIGSDVYARMKRMQGFNVLHPMGYDAFGLPAEQYALEHHIHPRKAVEENIKTFENQLSVIGLSYDWDRKVNTTDPNYYRWTQWIFLKLYGSWYNKDADKAEPIETLIKKFEKNPEWKAKTEKERQDELMKYRLAYEGYSFVNWCPILGTVLANDEVVDSPKGPVSERGGYPVVKKQMRQWFLRITAYADRLLSGLEGLNWSEHLKEIQRNWIGKSAGAEIEFEIIFENAGKTGRIPVFTTRPDTLFGATYMVLSPEHPWVTLALDENHKEVLKNRNEALVYVNNVKIKSEADRTDDKKEKTGVELKGVKAVNPANGEKIPVFIADYVLAHYGTGAIMAVPAHDERDFEFAKKYNLPIKNVVVPRILKDPKEGAETLYRNTVDVILENNKGEFLLISEGPEHVHFVGGGIESGETVIDAIKKETREESGYTEIQINPTMIYPTSTLSYRHTKNKNQDTIGGFYHVKLKSNARIPSEAEQGKHTMEWVRKNDVEGKITWPHHKAAWIAFLNNKSQLYIGNGLLFESGKFSGMDSEKAKKEITESVGGKIVTKYKMRDAVFARQRYWGEPIPLRYDKNGIITPLKERELPLKLPDVKSYQPTGTGESPLASVKAWTKAGYETNTMPGWAGSSWYYLRYMDPKNKKVFADKKAIQYWKDVDMYVGGAEHATGHLLYSRFWNKFLKDLGYVVTEEPFKTLKNQGLILGTDNRKMSKRWGNTIDPREVVKYYGADTLRVYEMFMGPFEGSMPWSTDNIIGSRRFIDRVWRVSGKVSKSAKTDKKLTASLHKTIRKVTDDISNFGFNTAVSSMMILLNEMEKFESINKSDFEMFLKILSPFAPHITEEIWSDLGHKSLLVTESWPKADPKKMLELEARIAIQVNNRVRAEATIIIGSSEDEVVAIAKEIPDIAKWLLGKEIRKTIYIKDKLLNFVVV